MAKILEFRMPRPRLRITEVPIEKLTPVAMTEAQWERMCREQEEMTNVVYRYGLTGPAAWDLLGPRGGH